MIHKNSGAIDNISSDGHVAISMTQPLSAIVFQQQFYLVVETKVLNSTMGTMTWKLHVILDINWLLFGIMVSWAAQCFSWYVFVRLGSGL